MVGPLGGEGGGVFRQTGNWGWRWRGGGDK